MASRKRRNKGSDATNNSGPEAPTTEPPAPEAGEGEAPEEASAAPEPGQSEPAPEPNAEAKSPEDHHEPDLNEGPTFEREFMVSLTSDEKQALHEELFELDKQLEAHEAAASLKKKELSDEKRSINKARRASINALETGSRQVLVKCREYKHVATNRVLIKRLDTGDVVEERALTAEERQQELFALDGGKADEPEPVDPTKVTNLAEAKARRDAQAAAAAESGESEEDDLPPIDDPLPPGFGTEGTLYTDDVIGSLDPEDRPNLERALADDEDEPASGLDVSEDPAGDIERALEDGAL